MAKDKERKTARILYVEHGKTAKEVAKLVGVTETTVSKWVVKLKWKKQRAAKTTAHENRLENIYKITEELASDRLDYNRQIRELLKDKEGDDVKEKIAELRKQIAQIDASVANWNKHLQTISKENQINQLVFIQVQFIIFKHFHIKFPKLTKEIIEFEEYLLNEIVPNYTT